MNSEFDTMASHRTVTLTSLQARIEALEKLSWINKNGLPLASDSSDSSTATDGGAIIVPTPEMRRARRHVQSAHCYSSLWKWCPPNYYSLTLEQRKNILGAASICQLCKACLFENKNFVPNEDAMEKSADHTNSKFYLVVVQYVESINTKKLSSELRGLRPPGRKRLDPNYFSDLRLAAEDVSEKLTGYGHNAVSPFGLVDSSIPIVLCKSILRLRPNFIWMGGGHKDLKLGMAVTEFVKAVEAIILDVSEPRIVLH